MPKWDNSGHLGVKESLHNEEMQGMGGSSISMVTKGREREDWELRRGRAWRSERTMFLFGRPEPAHSLDH